MAKMQEVPTDELLSFHDYPSVHSPNPQNTAQLPINQDFNNSQENESGAPLDEPSAQKSFWTLEYYQQFFDVETRDVLDRIIASITPKRDTSLKHHLRDKPDLYGPFWISVTLIFTIAISGNIANYLQHTNSQYHWKYNFQLVSYAATAIYIYVLLIPFALWGLLKWSSDVSDLEGLETGTTPSALELICIYGYSLFIYIPASILWSIQINLLQWGLVLVAAVVSGAVLLFTLLPALRLSRHKIFLMIGIGGCHLLLAAGFMLYFFHVPSAPLEHHQDLVKNITLKSI
ncbi:protein YIPF1 [Tribolium madens]|uniref:protein YIPF1 n=1 Tax=Tribolium madens TaxID=41895 RepID=UPI001CF75452|nr:protein YIPF1 [Tribolium madens]